MAAISGILVGGGLSATFNSSNGVSDVVVKKRKGAIFLEVQNPAGSMDWLLVSNESGAFNVATPDAALNYRFRGDANCDADYYMGP